ncbi:MAG: cytochrome b/b6 domain-containing protein [Paracoccus sp. (in: a-proteobacteria)]|uniref:cytochrome b/b6 domain-containing protein n=1 Tax=Paracoccus sp. TaxID=267 RepID=UPI0026DF22AD|nr:cytochrome b/b6 domain-containing protein [Paracoccus sp. (in: a-proteobacteria)]MDO5614171.1 cytochrome b/b6 domain-containing protein [Paracoccus sp. (in: a-proteobacteria)]
MSGGQTSTQPERVKLWDPLLRGFHWILAVLVIAAWCLGKFGPLNMWLHFWLGYTIIGLVAFRLIWGIVGPKPARFTSFVRGPGAIIGYARHMFERRPSYWPGHNPLGALSVLALLAVLIWQVGTGLIADPDDYINIGPLASEVSRATSRKAVGWHHLGANLILILVLLHVAVIMFYRFWKRENLIRPMLTGWKWVIRR